MKHPNAIMGVGIAASLLIFTIFSACSLAEPGTPVTTEATVGNPSDLKIYDDPELALLLSWTKGAGSTDTIVRYKRGSYPTSYNDGTLAGAPTEGSLLVTGLQAGATYRFRLWGHSGDNYSAGYAQGMRTVAAAVAGPSYQLETYYDWLRSRSFELQTVASWEGTEPRSMTVTVDKVPAMLNYGYTPTSSITSSLMVTACSGGTCVSGHRANLRWGSALALEYAGKYTIHVDSVGASWWVKLGVDP